MTPEKKAISSLLDIIPSQSVSDVSFFILLEENASLGGILLSQALHESALISFLILYDVS